MHEDVIRVATFTSKSGGLYTAKRERLMIDRLFSFRT